MGKIENTVLLQILAAKAGITAKVTNAFDTFATDGKCVYVPEWASKLPTDVLLGFFAHEAVGHIRMTDFETRSQIPLANSILNLLEDIRIESRIPLIFPGARRLLAETAYYAAIRFWQPPADDGDPLEQSFYWLVRKLRNELLGQLIEWERRTELSKIEKFLSNHPAWFEKCKQAFKIACEALARAEETCDLLPAAEKIAYLFASQNQSQGNQGNQDSQDSEQGNQGAQGNQGNQSSQGNQGDDGTQDTRNEPEEEDDGTSSQGSQSTQGNDGNQGTLGEPLQRQVDVDIGSLLQKGECPNARGNGILRVDPVNKEPFTPTDRTTPEEWEFSRRIAAKMRGGLQDALRRVLEDEDDRHTVAGRFDTRMAVNAYLGFSRDVFLEEGEEAPGLDARILLLVDSSGSMSDLESGVRAMLCGVVEAIGVIPEVDLGVAFYTSGVAYITNPGATRSLIQAAKGYLAAGGTNWHLSLCEALPWFFQGRRGRKKNILFTLTDGDVNMDQSSRALLRKAGIECRFLIIGNARYPDHIGGDYPVVRLPHDADATQVANGCLELLRDSILN